MRLTTAESDAVLAYLARGGQVNEVEPGRALELCTITKTGVGDYQPATGWSKFYRETEDLARGRPRVLRSLPKKGKVKASAKPVGAPIDWTGFQASLSALREKHGAEYPGAQAFN